MPPCCQANAAVQLKPRNKATGTASLVNRLTNAGTQSAFLAAATTVIQRLERGDIPTVDYNERRLRLRTLKSIPAATLHEGDPTLVATAARRRNAAAWLWAHLTGGHVWEAPAWGKDGAPESSKENYRRFLKRDLDRLRPTLLNYGQTLLQATDASPGDA